MRHARIRREDWPALLADFRAGGATQAEFCRRRGLSLAGFRYRLYRANRATAAATARFVPVRLVPEPPVPTPADALVVVLPGGRRLAVAPGFDADTLARVVAVLERRT